VDDKVIIAVINGDLIVKRVKKKGEKLLLVPDNKDYAPIEVREDMDFEVWGVVMHVIHTL